MKGWTSLFDSLCGHAKGKIAESLLRKKNQVEGLVLLDVRAYYEAIVITTERHR